MGGGGAMSFLEKNSLSPIIIKKNLFALCEEEKKQFTPGKTRNFLSHLVKKINYILKEILSP